MDLLQTYIMQLVERTYSRVFKFDVFKKLSGEEQFEYVDENLRPLGKGTSRWVYLINSKRVLKLAVNDAGVDQNKNELDAFQDPVSRRYVTRVLAHAPDMSWLVSELVKPLKNEEAGDREFESLTGISFELLCDAIWAADDAVGSAAWLRDIMTKDKDEFLKGLLKFIKKAKLSGSDISLLQQWGKTPDGRAVLLDYGLTDETWNQHYAISSPMVHFKRHVVG